MSASGRRVTGSSLFDGRKFFTPLIRLSSPRSLMRRFPREVKPLKSSPPGVPLMMGVEVPPAAEGTVMREISRVRRTYSKAAVSAPADLSSFYSSAISSLEIALSGDDR